MANSLKKDKPREKKGKNTVKYNFEKCARLIGSRHERKKMKTIPNWSKKRKRERKKIQFHCSTLHCTTTKISTISSMKKS